MAWKWDAKLFQADKGLYDLDESTSFVRGNCQMISDKKTFLASVRFDVGGTCMY